MKALGEGVLEHRLGDLLNDPSLVPWDHDLFLGAERERWSTDSIALTISGEELDDLDGHREAGRRGLIYILGFADVQDIVENARAQRPDAEPRILLTALKFYIANDAFIVLP